jgi:segregation and condensation protein A
MKRQEDKIDPIRSKFGKIEKEEISLEDRTEEIRKYGERKIKEWMIEEFEPGHTNIERIFSPALINEFLLTDG